MVNHMRFKTTWIMGLVFAILGGYVYYTDFRNPGAKEKAESEKKLAIRAELQDITEVSIISTEHTITGVRKGEKHWDMTAPAGVEADPEEWELLAGNVGRIEREQTVTDNATDLAQFELDNPPLQVKAKLKNGQDIHIQFGGENPRKIYHYARFAGSNEVFLTPSSWFRIFQKNPNDLRNKKVLDFEADNIDRIRIQTSGNEFQFVRNGNDWRIEKPLQTVADATEVNGLLSAVRFARAADFAGTGIDARAAGLEPPSAQVAFHDAKAGADRVLLVGKAVDDTRFYVKDSARPVIFIVDKDVVEKSRRPLVDWRDKSLAKIERDKVDTVELTRGTEKLVLKKEGNDWKLSDGRKLQWDKVSSMFNALEFDRARDIIDAPGALSSYGLDRPAVDVVMRQGSSELLRFAIGGKSTKPEGVYWKATAKPNVLVVGDDVLERFAAKVDDLVDKTP